MADQEGEGFVIRDRRGKGVDHDTASSPTPSVAASDQASTTTGSPADSPQAPDRDQPVTFSSFVFSLGTSALMLMGEQLDPQQPKQPVNLGQAKEIIDIISILEEKTRGNLSSEEQGILKDMLYALRMKYVDLASGTQHAPSS